MADCYVIVKPGGQVDIIHLAVNPPGSMITDLQWEAWALVKTMFERTRPNNQSGRNEHFNSDIPTHIARANGVIYTKMTDADLPTDRSLRARWRKVDGKVVVV